MFFPTTFSELGRRISDMGQPKLELSPLDFARIAPGCGGSQTLVRAEIIVGRFEDHRAVDQGGPGGSVTAP